MANTPGGLSITISHSLASLREIMVYLHAEYASRNVLMNSQIFYSFFKTLVGEHIAVELKNGLTLKGTLESVDPYLNVKLNGISTDNAASHPHLASVQNCFIRGSVVRYIHLPREKVDTSLLQEATRKEASQASQK